MKLESLQPRVSMITLGVRDLERSIKFYEALGLPRLPGHEGVAFFTLAGTWLGLYPWDKLAEDAGLPEAGEGFRGVALAYNVVSPEEADAVVGLAARAGGAVVKAPGPVFWGGYSGYFADPDGFLWEVAHNPFAWIGPPDAEGRPNQGPAR